MKQLIQHKIKLKWFFIIVLLIMKSVCYGLVEDKFSSLNQIVLSKSTGAGLSGLSVADNIDESVTNGLLPNVLELVRKARASSQQLDSIEEFQMNITYTEAIKEYFVYNGGKLKESRFLYHILGKPVYMEEQRSYNENEQILDYQKFEQMTGYKDGLLLTEREEYSYENNRVKTYRHTTVDPYYNVNTTVDGVFYPAGTAIYKIFTKYYEYIDSAQTIRISDSGNIDFSILHFDSLGRLDIEYYYEYSSDGADSILYRTFHYNYSETDSSSHMILENRYYTDTSEKGYKSTWHYIDFWKDVQGRVSVYEHVYIQEGLEAYPMLITRIEYTYNSNVQLLHASLFVPAVEYQMDSLIELGHFDYTYDANSLVTNLLQTFYDERIQQWTTYAERKYFYSPIQSTKVEQPKLKNEFTLFPNPATDHVTVKVKNDAQVDYKIYDLYGSQVLSGNLLSNTIDVSGLARGTYLLKLQTNDTTQIKRFIKNNNE